MYLGTLSAHDYRALPLDARIRLAASELLGKRYSRDVGFPVKRGSIPSSLVRPGGIDCSSLVAYILMTVYPSEFTLWTGEHYAGLQIMDAARPWSPIEAVERAGVGSRVPRPVGGSWHVTQRWKSLSPLSGGHARLCYAHEDDPDLLDVLEATTRDGGIGATWSTARWSALTTGAQALAAALGEG